MTRLALTLGALLLLGGCASSDPAPSGADGATAEGELAPRSVVVASFREAARDFSHKLSAHAAQGWPAHVALGGSPPRPSVRVGDISNRTREHVDIMGLRDDLVQLLVEQGVVHVLASDPRAYETPGDERLTGEGDGASAADELDADDAASYVVTGTLEDEVTEQDGVVNTTTTIVLRMVAVRDRGLTLQTRTVTRSSRER